MWGGWQDFHWLKTAQFCHFSIPGWTHLILFMPSSKAALELYKIWIGDHMEDSATVGIDQGLKGQPLVNTWPQALGVFVFSIVWGLPGSSFQGQICCPWGQYTKATSYSRRWVGVEAFRRRCLKKLKPLSSVIQLWCLWNLLNAEGRWAESIPYRLCRMGTDLSCYNKAQLPG